MQTLEKPTLSKEDWLYIWCKDKKLFSSVDAKKWGIDNYYSRSDRTVRDFVFQRKLRKLSGLEILLKGLWKKGNAHIAWYEIV